MKTGQTNACRVHIKRLGIKQVSKERWLYSSSSSTSSSFSDSVIIYCFKIQVLLLFRYGKANTPGDTVVILANPKKKGHAIWWGMRGSKRGSWQVEGVGTTQKPEPLA